MDKLDRIGDGIRERLEEKTAARDRALQLSRELIRFCSKAIRAVHRDERQTALDLLAEARSAVAELHATLTEYPELLHAGYAQSALKEFAEASIVFGLVMDNSLPDPDELSVGDAPYLGGLGEAAGELRRKVLDILRGDQFGEAERLLSAMDDIYALLVTIDFPDAVTGNLRRITDMVRGVTERTRGDLTTSFQQHDLKEALKSVERKLDDDTA